MSKTYQRTGYPVSLHFFQQLCIGWQTIATIWILTTIVTIFIASTFEYLNNRITILRKPIMILHFICILILLTFPTYLAFQVEVSVGLLN
jgi:hypothetical protein